MKVKVIREMPFAKVGEKIELDHGSIVIRGSLFEKSSDGIICIENGDVKEMIKRGWLEEIPEEKSLEDKIGEGR